MWVARISEKVNQIIVTGMHAGSRWRQTVQLPAEAARSDTALGTSAPAIAMHWTRSKIDALLDEQRFSADRELNKHAITQLAMNAGLVSSYTSFVAIEDQPARPFDEQLTKQHVANLILKGNEMINIPMPQGTAGVDTLTVLSLVLAISGLGLYRLSRARNHR